MTKISRGLSLLLALVICPLALVAADSNKLAEEAVNLANSARYEEAAQKFEQAIALDPKNASLYLGLGLVFQSLKRYDEAIRHLEKAVDLNKSLTEAYYSLGLLYEARLTDSEIETSVELRKQYLRKAKAVWEKFLKLSNDPKKIAIAKKHLIQTQEELKKL